MSSIYQRQFSSGEVTQAADITMSTLQNWLKRDVIVGHKKIEGGGSQGKHRRFSWFNVMEIATAATLVKAGVTDLAIAFYAAQSFAHVGAGPLPGVPVRSPALPFDVEHGRTLLFAAGQHCEIMPYDPRGSGSDVLSTIRVALRRPEAFVVVDMLDVFDRVCLSLGLHPQAVMDAEYSEAQG